MVAEIRLRKINNNSTAHITPRHAPVAVVVPGVAVAAIVVDTSVVDTTER